MKGILKIFLDILKGSYESYDLYHGTITKDYIVICKLYNMILSIS